jgi:hypothetical protein
VTQKLCDRAAEQEPGAELVVRHRASRLRLDGGGPKWDGSTVFTVRGVTSKQNGNHATD